MFNVPVNIFSVILGRGHRCRSNRVSVSTDYSGMGYFVTGQSGKGYILREHSEKGYQIQNVDHTV